MNHEELFIEVKNEYARIASEQSQKHPPKSLADMSPEVYYEKRLNQVLNAISLGDFDAFECGADIVAAVEKDPEQWIQ